MKDKTKSPVDIPVIIPSDAPRIYANGAFGGYTAQDFRLLFFSEEPLEQDTIITNKDLGLIREVQCEIILAPLAAKQLCDWLTNQINEYESKIGKIAIPTKPKENKKTSE